MWALAAVAVVAQWNTTISIEDTSRTSLLHPSGRVVTVTLCGAATYPATAVVDSGLPLYIWAHGFDCRGEDYAWFCSASGVVTALVHSSDITPFLPDTKDLALDQAFLSVAIPAMAQNASSPLYRRLSGKVILGGHSMGGGTTVLAADPTFAPLAKIGALAMFAPG